MKCPYCKKTLPKRKLSPEQKAKAVIRTQLWRLRKAQEERKKTGH